MFTSIAGFISILLIGGFRGLAQSAQLISYPGFDITPATSISRVCYRLLIKNYSAI